MRSPSGPYTRQRQIQSTQRCTSECDVERATPGAHGGDGTCRHDRARSYCRRRGLPALNAYGEEVPV